MPVLAFLFSSGYNCIAVTFGSLLDLDFGVLRELNVKSGDQNRVERNVRDAACASLPHSGRAASRELDR